MNMQLYYEEENINNELNRMNEVELMSNYAHDLMDRLSEIRRLRDEEYYLNMPVC